MMLVMVGLLTQKPRVIIYMAVIGSAFTALGFILSPDGSVFQMKTVIINRGLALFAIWSTAIVSYIHLTMLVKLEPLATTDQLTGLFNRHYFTSELVKQINTWRRYQRPLSIIMLDIDHFKKVNDTYGHLAGDYALQSMAKICQHMVRDIDTVARIGGEEFAILLPSTGENGAMQTAERIRQETEKFGFRYEGRTFKLTVSLGIAELTDETWSITEFIKAADEMLYKAKEAGRNRCVARNIG